jgi:hypothetical protein
MSLRQERRPCRHQAITSNAAGKVAVTVFVNSAATNQSVAIT